MPKMKTKSAAKKRFKITGTGKVLSAAAGKRHGMIKRSNKFIRNARGTMVLAEPDGKQGHQEFPAERPLRHSVRTRISFTQFGTESRQAPGIAFKEIMTWHA